LKSKDPSLRKRKEKGDEGGYLLYDVNGSSYIEGSICYE